MTSTRAAPLRWLMPIVTSLLAIGNVFLLSKLAAIDKNIRGSNESFDAPDMIKKLPTEKVQAVHVSTNIHDGSSKMNNLVVYNHNPNDFADTFAKCSFYNPNCKIHYHHVQKTGGSRLASRLYPVFSNGGKYSSKQWCCQDEMMDRVNANVSHYCEHNKFGIYEVSAPQYSAVIQSCIDYNDTPKRNETQLPNEPNEIIGLMTIREPIQLTLSQLHHQCNKNFKQKSPQEQKMCRSCNFLKNQTYFMEYVKQTNMVYLEIAREIPRLLTMLNGQATEYHHETVHKMMILDQADIDSFFKSLESRSPDGTVIPDGRGNEEQTKHCYFGVTSHMMKALRPSLEIYRHLSGGLVWQPVPKKK